MSHGGMTFAESEVMVERLRKVAQITAARRKRYEDQLIEEYSFVKDFLVTLKSRDGEKTFTLGLDELFDMYDLTKDKREHKS